VSQNDRLLTYLRERPGASSLEIVRDLGILNTTGRVSDLRAAGHVIEARRVEGVFRYWLSERVQMELALA
jgi:hypothetical protein